MTQSSSSRCARCCCCSLQAMAIFAAFVAVFVTVVNPVLDRLIAPLADIDATTPAVEQQQRPFDPSTTDILGYDRWTFTPRGATIEVYLGRPYIMRQSYPRWMVKLAERYDPATVRGFSGDKNKVEKLDPKVFEENGEKHEVDIFDARRAAGTFAERGFTLVDMGDAPSARGDQDWRSRPVHRAFQRDLEPRLRELHPDATRFVFTYTIVRGGARFGDQPAALDGVHLDYSQNDTAREAFHAEFPPFLLEPQHLLGRHGTDADEIGALLGVWKPVMMTTPVCDHPLAVMDARTFRIEDETEMRLHINSGSRVIGNLNGNVHHHPDQRYYYYPFQTDSEVLVFTQYSRGRHFANPHGSFVNPNCPEGSDRRLSVEMRVAVYFPK